MSIFCHWFELREQRPFKKVDGSHERESKSSRVRLISSQKKSKNRSGRSDRGVSDGRGVVRDLPNSSSDTVKKKKLPAGTTGDDLFTEKPSLGCLNTRPYSRSLLGVDFSVNCERSLSPPSLSLSPSPSSLLDLLGHPRGGGTVSHASGDGWGVAVKETTKSIVIDTDEVHEI